MSITPIPSHINSSFHRFTTTPDEVLSGSILSNMQIAVIQNLRVDIAEQKLALTFTPEKMYDFVQQESFLSGQLEILQFLIDSSEASQKAVLARTVNQSHSSTTTADQE